MFNTDKFTVLKNPIDTELYTYNKEKSEKIRKKLGINNKFVIGHVGSFTYQKNHEFIINIFKELKQLEPRSILMLIGDGELKDKTFSKVKELNLEKDVLILGTRRDIYDLMQAMDVFLFPSRYEGLGIVLIEAQASGLRCVISDKIPNDGIISSNVDVISLEKNEIYWAKKIIQYSKGYERKDIKQTVIKSGFDVGSNVKWLENFYLEK